MSHSLAKSGDSPLSSRRGFLQTAALTSVAVAVAGIPAQIFREIGAALTKEIRITDEQQNFIRAREYYKGNNRVLVPEILPPSNQHAEREWAYDRRSSIGRLDKALDEATARGWVVVDMKQDWKVIYPFQK